jgi:hypothetical protein
LKRGGDITTTIAAHNMLDAFLRYILGRPIKFLVANKSLKQLLRVGIKHCEEF